MGSSSLKSFSLKVLSTANHHHALSIARALPEWFSERALQLMTLDMVYQRGALAMDGENPLGFISFFVNQGKAVIAWMGVKPEHQDQGIGKFLISKLVAELASAGASEISVRVLGDSIEYEPYERTRAFFRGFGFKDAEVIPNPEDSDFAEALQLVFKI